MDLKYLYVLSDLVAPGMYVKIVAISGSQVSKRRVHHMSLVIAAISKDNDIIVCGEGRSVNPITDEILAEDTIKAFKLNSSLIIAYVGNDTKTTPLKVHLLKLCINYYKTWDVENIYKEALKY